MKRLALAAGLFLTLAAPAARAEDSKEVSCSYQGQVAAAVQKARLDRVPESDVEATILASNPTWPQNYSAAIPQLTGWVYQQKRRDLRKVDLGAFFEAQCLENWDQIQEMKRNMGN